MNIKIYPEAEQDFLNTFPEYSKLLLQILYNRGFKSKETIDRFLKPTDEVIQSPFDLAEIDQAIERILNAREKNEKVYIYGDYDVDGVTATSLLWDFLYRKLQMKVLPYIPSRFDEGYGLGKKGLDHIIENDGKLIITVDCGIRDTKLINDYHEKVDFIITDHHSVSEDETGKKLISEEAIATVHPKHPNSNFEFQEICGAAVAWKLVNALYTHCKQNNLIDFGFFTPDEYLDLVSLATVTDIMPLKSENRVLLKKGLDQIKSTKNIGLRTLMLKANINPLDIQTYHFGFVIGPRLNAAGRIETALDAVRLLSTNNLSDASDYADKLNNLNIYRQNITKKILEEAQEKVQDSQNLDQDKILFVWGHEWPEGVVGLVAGKLQEEFYRPVLVATIHDGIATGSARSIPEFDVTEAISMSKEILERFGGHVQAAGFTVREENLQQFKQEIIDYANRNIDTKHLQKVLSVDLELDIDDLDKEILRELEPLKPHGMGNPTPTFLFRDLKIFQKKILGKDKNHVKLIFKNRSNENIELLGFNKVSDFEHIDEGDRINVVGTLDKNVWNGMETIQIKLKDFKKSE